MNISPSVLAYFVVLASSDVWVSVKNDDLEATVVALPCTLLRLFSSEKGKNLLCSKTYFGDEGDNETAGKE